MKRMGVVLAGVALMAVLIAGPVAAQAERQRFVIEPSPFTLNTANPCDGELVTITGESEGFIQLVVTPSGQTSTKLHMRFQGTGVGSQGNKYVFSDTSNNEVKDGPPATITQSFKLISQGPADNFVQNAVIHVSPNGQAHFNSADSECRG